MTISIGDRVRVHFHPPYPEHSFIEGTVNRIDEALPEGPLIVVDVSHQVIFGREFPIGRGHQEYILLERWTDFPNQIEVLSRATDLPHGRLPEEIDQDVLPDPSPVLPSEQMAAPEPVDEAPPLRDARRRGNFISALFGRGK